MDAELRVSVHTLMHTDLQTHIHMEEGISVIHYSTVLLFALIFYSFLTQAKDLEKGHKASLSSFYFMIVGAKLVDWLQLLIKFIFSVILSHTVKGTN